MVKYVVVQYLEYIVSFRLCFFELLNIGIMSPKEFLHGILRKFGRRRTAFTCADNGDITRLDLNGWVSNNKLTGTLQNIEFCKWQTSLPHDIFDDVMRTVGSIPTEVGRLIKLTRLGLGSNQLTGKRPIRKIMQLVDQFTI